MVYEIWSGDEFINYCYDSGEALRLAEAGYSVRPADGYGE